MNLLTIAKENGFEISTATSFESNSESFFLCMSKILTQSFVDKEKSNASNAITEMDVDADVDVLDVVTLKKMLAENLECTAENQSLLLKHYLRCRSQETWIKENKQAFDQLHNKLLNGDEDARKSNLFLTKFNEKIMNGQMWPDLCYIPYLFRILAVKNVITHGYFVVIVDTEYEILGTFEAGSHNLTDRMIILSLDREDLTLNLVVIDHSPIYLFNNEEIENESKSWIEALKCMEITLDQIENYCRIASTLSIPLQDVTTDVTTDVTKKMTNLQLSPIKLYAINPITKRKILMHGEAWKKLEKSQGSDYMNSLVCY